MASLNKQKRDAFYAIIRKNKYGNIDSIHYQCSIIGISVSREKLVKYTQKLKKEYATSMRNSAILRQHKIKILLSQIRTKESLLLKELNDINLKLNRKQQF